MVDDAVERALDDIPLRRRNGRYMPADEAVAGSGTGKNRPLGSHSPQGCSKSAAGQDVELAGAGRLGAARKTAGAYR